MRYGEATGQATNSAIDCTINVVVAALNFDNLVIKGLTKAARMQTARPAAEDSNPQEKRGKEEENKEE
ncbi:hypothetical protein SKAU_G00325100 [Synaphobranchus kaupii]|uniref:Uncharacterized protein n=1 Tax=Synaphobranchus kaupii TaxID=118154 RepID=A0A9Q1EPH0_SYNKA|nr:hypothetical protein SKAU_G00325100 [Synaphobranchus kaupii]